MLRALELAIGSTADGKNVEVREDVGGDLECFLEPNFRNMEWCFMWGLFSQKLADGERSNVSIVKSFVWKRQTG